MRSIKSTKSMLFVCSVLLLIIIVMFGCPLLPVDILDDPADSGGGNYQGYPVISDPNEIEGCVEDGTYMTIPCFIVSQVQNAQAYRLQVAMDIEFTSVVYDENEFDENVIDAIGLDSSLMKSLDTRYWRACAKIEDNWGAWSETRSFIYLHHDTVYFDTLGGTEPTPEWKSVILEQPYGVLPVVSKLGYVFDGWWTGVGGTGSEVISTTTVVNENGHVVYAKWLPPHTVSFKSNGGSVVADIEAVVHGTKISAPIAPTRSGYVFDGWYKDSGLSTPWNFDNDIVINDVTLYAKWQPPHTVRFESNGGSPVAPISNVVHKTTIFTPSVPTKSGKMFDGWYKDRDLVSPWNFSNDKVLIDIILYAKWRNFRATFINDSGNFVPAVENIISGSKISEPTAPMRNGYVFDGWYKEQELVNQWNFNTDTVVADITLYSKWRNYEVDDIGTAGGEIFYDKGYYSYGWRYLEAAPAEWNQKWGGYDPYAHWGVSVEGTGTEIGTGKSNTNLIVAKLGDGDYAAKACDDLVITNNNVAYDDWFLPSKDELTQMYYNCYENGIPAFTIGWFWSSSEHSTYTLTAWYQDFRGGQKNYASKDTINRVRAVRAF